METAIVLYDQAFFAPWVSGQKTETNYEEDCFFYACRSFADRDFPGAGLGRIANQWIRFAEHLCIRRRLRAGFVGGCRGALQTSGSASQSTSASADKSGAQATAANQVAA